MGLAAFSARPRAPNQRRKRELHMPTLRAAPSCHLLEEWDYLQGLALNAKS